MTPQQAKVLQEVHNMATLLINVAERPLEVEKRLRADIAGLMSTLETRLVPLGPVQVDAEVIKVAVREAVIEALGDAPDATA